MKPNLSPLISKLMSRVGALTQSGRLMEATEAIQRALGGHGHGHGHGHAAPPSSAAAPGGTDAAVLDGLVREVPEPVTRQPAPPQAQPQPEAQPQAEPERQPIRPAPAPVAEESASPRFQLGSFTAEAGTRAYKLFIPSGHGGKPLPLVVMLHGCTQDPDDFARGTRMNELAQEQGFLVLYPAQAPRSNSSKCWNWFEPGDQRRGRGEPALLAGMARHVMATHAVDADRVYVAGLSAGGAMAAILGREYGDLFAAVGVHSGLPHGAAHSVGTAFQAMKSGPLPTRASQREGRVPPTIVFHGDRDRTVHPINGQQVVGDALGSAQSPEPTVVTGAARDGRNFTHTAYRDSSGRVCAEHWEVHGAGHAWSGGSVSGSYVDAQGPDASREMWRFFAEHTRVA